MFLTKIETAAVVFHSKDLRLSMAPPCPGAQDYLEIIILGRVLTEDEDDDGNVLSLAY